MYLKLFLILCMYLFTCQVGGAQTYPYPLMIDFQKKMKTMPEEQLYLQTSKDIYETGEDLWFKAYQLNSQSFSLSDKSKTLYLEMTGLNDSVVWQEKYPIRYGITTGHVYVDEKLPEGEYCLWGYTKCSFYMEDTISHAASRKIRIVRSIARTSTSTVARDSAFRFLIFPEGGRLVSGLPSRLAFKATDGKGIPIETRGRLYEGGRILCELATAHDGMGSVHFLPEAGKDYRIELDNGRSYPLPEIHPSGMSFHLQSQDGRNLEFLVGQSGDFPERTVYLAGQLRGMFCCMARIPLKTSLKVRIPSENFPYQGVAEFTLYDENMRPVAERLAYVRPERKLHISMVTDKERYTLRERGTVHIKVTDEKGQPVRANLGLSIYDRVYNTLTGHTNILAQCCLSSQIRGRIHNPEYYFDEGNADRMEALDLLLLTQGWRKYVWNTATVSPDATPFLTDGITGRHMIRSGKRRESNGFTEQAVQVSGPEGNSSLVWTDSTGHFTVSPDLMESFRGGHIYLKPMLSKEFKPALEINDCFPALDSLKRLLPDYYSFTVSEGGGGQEDAPLVVGNDSTILLDEVLVRGKNGKVFRDRFIGRLDSLSQANLGGAWVCCHGTGHTYFLNDYQGYSHHPKGCPHMQNYEGKKLAPVKGKIYRVVKYVPHDKFWIVEDVKDIVYRGPEYTEEELLRMNNLWRAKGYYANREFYEPDEADMQLSIPDARNTLLWAPNINTDNKGEASVSFYCSDVNTSFVCCIEGVGGDGMLGNVQCNFYVTRQ